MKQARNLRRQEFLKVAATPGSCRRPDAAGRGGRSGISSLDNP